MGCTGGRCAPSVSSSQQKRMRRGVCVCVYVSLAVSRCAQTLGQRSGCRCSRFNAPLAKFQFQQCVAERILSGCINLTIPAGSDVVAGQSNMQYILVRQAVVEKIGFGWDGMGLSGCIAAE